MFVRSDPQILTYPTHWLGLNWLGLNDPDPPIIAANLLGSNCPFVLNPAVLVEPLLCCVLKGFVMGLSNCC